MPFPLLLVAGPALLAAAKSSLVIEALLVGGPYLAAKWYEGNKESVREWGKAAADFLVPEISGAAGVDLDKDDPFSDASLSAAMTKKTGVPLRTLRDKETIKSDLEYWALAKVEEKVGLHLRDVRNVEKTKADVVRFLTPYASQKTGIPLSDLTDKEKTKAELKVYAQEQALYYLAEDIERAKAIITNSGVDLAGLAEKAQKLSGIDPRTGKPVVMVDINKITLGILSKAVLLAGRAARLASKESARELKKREKNRRASASFRKSRGSRLVYVPVGGGL